MKYDVFVSYSHKDENLVEPVVNRLEAFGLTTFFASRDLVAGRDWAGQIVEAIENSTDCLLLLTESYIDSSWAEQETMHATKLGMRVLPVVTAPEKLSSLWKYLIGNIQWITGTFEDASAKAINILVEEKRERKKAEILNRAYEYWNYGEFYEAELDFFDLLKDPLYANDPEINMQYAHLLEDERLYNIGTSIDANLLIDLYKKVVRFGDREKHKAIIENAELAIKRLEIEAASKQPQIPKTNADETFALAVLTARMESANRFEQYMGSSVTAAELNCLLIDYTQMVNFASVFSVKSGELEDRVKQCRSKISEIKEQLKTGELAQGKETILVKAYRNYLGLARPEYPIYDVFISCKSEDEKYARQVYDFLLLNGKRAFFSKETISALGNSEYHDAIMGALDHSRHFILVSSSMDYLNSSWVKHEWSTYIGESVEGRKNGNMVLVFHEDFHFKKEELPIDIRRKEIISLSSFRNTLADYVN